MKHYYLKKKTFMDDITDSDYIHTKTVCKDFEIKDLGEYHNLYFKNDGLFLPDVLENFREMCLKNYCLESKFLNW